MKLAAIIAEYNPFHEGHGYLIKKVKEDTGADAVVAVMSGDFTQRGEPAIVDKFTRTHMALSQGIDLVVQLPGIFVLSDADGFAAGAVAICKAMDVDVLAFGSEEGDAESLKKVAKMLAEEDDEFKGYLREALDEGFSYPAARSMAAEKKMPGAGTILEGSNNILGIEYIKAAIDQKAGFDFYTTERIGSGFGEKNVEAGKIPSALAIRTSLDKDMGNAAEINGLPTDTAKLLNEIKPYVKSELNDFYGIFRSKILLSGSDDFSNIYGAREGLSNRIKDAARKAEDMDILDEIVSTKRYTVSRLHRTYLQMLFDLEKDEYEKLKEAFCYKDAAYIRVLGFNETGRKVLSYFKEQQKASKGKAMEEGTPIITNINKQKENLKPEAAKIIEFDMKISDIYNMVSGRDLYEFSDMVHGPVIL